MKNEAQKNSFSKIYRVKVVVGELRTLNLETLTFIFESISADTPLLKEASLEFVEHAAKVKCNKCGHTWDLKPEELDPGLKQTLHYSGLSGSLQLTCPNCKASDFTIKEGRELYVSEIEAVHDGKE